jgi:hypothetical protein
MTFKNLGYQIERNVLSTETTQLLSIEFNLLRDCMFLQSGQDLNTVGFRNDLQVTKSFAWYSAYCFESLLLMMQPLVENITEKKLYPTYSYGRIYYNNAIMARHRDRPSCQYSVTLTLEIDDSPWEIWFEDLQNNSTSINLAVGDMCVYKGVELTHWRDSYKGKKQIQAFLHYVDANGEYSHLKYDGRPYLGFSASR